MDKNLLKEFIIEEYEKDFVVYATDEAYRLLGVEVPQPVSPVTEYTVDRTHYVVIRNVSGDTIDVEYYREAVLTYLASRYRIDGLLRESDGNSHDANWQYEVYIFNTGYCPEELSSCIIKTGGLYLSATRVLKKEKITEEIIETWSEEYDLDGNGEGQRTVYCSTPDGSAHFAFGLSLSWDLGRELPENRYPLALRTSRADQICRTGYKMRLPAATPAGSASGGESQPCQADSEPHAIKAAPDGGASECSHPSLWQRICRFMRKLFYADHSALQPCAITDTNPQRAVAGAFREPARSIPCSTVFAGKL